MITGSEQDAAARTYLLVSEWNHITYSEFFVLYTTSQEISTEQVSKRTDAPFGRSTMSDEDIIVLTTGVSALV